MTFFVKDTLDQHLQRIFLMIISSTNSNYQNKKALNVSESTVNNWCYESELNFKAILRDDSSTQLQNQKLYEKATKNGSLDRSPNFRQIYIKTYYLE